MEHAGSLVSDKPPTILSDRVRYATHELQSAERLEKRPPLDPFEARFNPLEAAHKRRRGEELLVAPEGLVGAGTGELMPPASLWPAKTNERLYLLDTLETPSVINVDASEHRITLAMRAGALSAALDTAQTVQAANAIEKMLCHQMAAAHARGMEFLGMLEDSFTFKLQPVDQARLANAAARQFDICQSAALVLQKLKTGGTQRVVVQHLQSVNVGPGGRAVVAQKMKGGRRAKGRGRGASRTGGGRTK